MVFTAHETRGLMSAIKNQLEMHAGSSFTLQQIYDLIYEWPAIGRIEDVSEALELLVAGYEVEKLTTQAGDRWAAL